MLNADFWILNTCIITRAILLTELLRMLMLMEKELPRRYGCKKCRITRQIIISIKTPA